MAPGGSLLRFPEHLGTAYLRAVLRRAGIGSRHYLPKMNPGLSGFAGFLREFRPQVIGFTLYESNLNATRAMVQTARETLPGSVVAVGGPNATFSPEETLELLEADVCVRGAGEGTIVSLVGRILGSDSGSRRLPDLLGEIPNLALRSGDTICRTRAEDLSSFPARYFATLDDIPSPFQDGLVTTPEIGYLSARGCNQHCTYCSFAALSARRVALHSVERVLDDLEALQSLVARIPSRDLEIPILDDTFTLAPERARRICEGILERGVRLRLTCVTRGDRVTSDLLGLMRRAGFRGVAFGLESAVPRVLRTIGKVCAPSSSDDPTFERERQFLDRFRGSVQAAQRLGLAVSVSVIGGLPGEAAEDFRKTLEFVNSLEVGEYSHNLLSVFPGTPLHDQRLAFGLDCFRDRGTAAWRTVHAYAASEIPPLRNSDRHLLKWSSARMLSDALCGRAGELEADRNSVWAVILHRCPRSPQLAAWLRRALAIGGSVVTFDGSRADADKWEAFLVRSKVPFGSLTHLVPDRNRRKASFDVQNSIGKHRVELLSECELDAVGASAKVDARGDWRFRVWLASVPDAGIRSRPNGGARPIGPGPEVADSCRVWGDSPRRLRCLRPHVLHVDSEGRIRACWYGRVIGTIGVNSAERGSRTRAAAAGNARSPRHEAPRRCPLEPVRGLDDSTSSRLWDLDLGSQLSWLFDPGRRDELVEAESERSDPWQNATT